MSAFTFSAAAGIIVLCICIAVRAVRLVFMIVKILFAVLFKILKIFTRRRKYSKPVNQYISSQYSKNISPEEIGKKGEDALCRKLRKIEKQGRILRNLYIPLSNGNTTEIDAVMLTKHGIYVFEYKNYHCNLFVPENVECDWLRCSYDGESVYNVYSPVRQNELHVNAIKNVLGKISGLRGVENLIKPYVVIGDGCNIRYEKAVSEKMKVVNLADFNSLEKEQTTAISDVVLILIGEILSKYIDASESEKLKHIWGVKNFV